MNNPQVEFWCKLFKNDIEDFVNKIIDNFPEHKDRIQEIIPQYVLKLNNNNIDNLDQSQCEARTFKNGEEGRCSKDKLKGCDFCKRHSTKLIYGKITDPIPPELEKKFTKRMRTTRVNNIDNDSLYKIEIELNDLQKPNNDLKTVVIMKNKFLYDNTTSIIYTNEENPKYVGTFIDNYIIR